MNKEQLRKELELALKSGIRPKQDKFIKEYINARLAAIDDGDDKGLLWVKVEERWPNNEGFYNAEFDNLPAVMGIEDGVVTISNHSSGAPFVVFEYEFYKLKWLDERKDKINLDEKI